MGVALAQRQLDGVGLWAGVDGSTGHSSLDDLAGAWSTNRSLREPGNAKRSSGSLVSARSTPVASVETPQLMPPRVTPVVATLLFVVANSKNAATSRQGTTAITVLFTITARLRS